MSKIFMNKNIHESFYNEKYFNTKIENRLCNYGSVSSAPLTYVSKKK
jgi:hypothetical protein